MDQSKELRALYLKGYMVGNHCNILLEKPISGRMPDGTYTHLASKGALVHATIMKQNEKVVYKVVFEGDTVYVPLTDAKVR